MFSRFELYRRMKFLLFAMLVLATAVSCAEAPDEADSRPQANTQQIDESGHSRSRMRMVEQHLAGRDIENERVLAAMKRVPRHRFVPEELQHRAYSDSPLPIGDGQTISQPYVVALMTQLAEPDAEDKALDIGTGSGYQAAVLAELVDEVYSLEIVEPLATEARERLETLGYENVIVRQGDGYRGWPEEAPFDIIIVAAAPGKVPQPLVEQLAPGGKMVIPVGNWFQNLLLIEKATDGTVSRQKLTPVSFVPMTGEAQTNGSENEN